MEVKPFLLKEWNFIKKNFDLLVDMINLYKLKIESKVHDKIDLVILKQFTNKSNDLHE